MKACVLQEFDFRSDTVTMPTPEMMQAMVDAELGDAARGDDPTVNRLQALAAEMTGKDASIFLPAGAMANLSALIAHGVYGGEIIVDAAAHIYNAEGGALSSVAGGTPRPVAGVDGMMPIEAIADVIRGEANPALAPTRAICVENTHNDAGGMVGSLDYMAAVRKLADKAGLPVHLDGARLFNAATYLNVPVSEITKHVDSVMFATCKGLGAPVGAMLAGDKDFIAKAWRAAKMLGGGMRQAGLLAAPVIVALKDPYAVHRKDHALAQLLAEGLAALDKSLVDVSRVHTNIVNCYVDKFDKDAARINAKLRAKGVLAIHKKSKIRFVTHYGVDEKAAEAAIAAFADVLNELGQAA